MWPCLALDSYFTTNAAYLIKDNKVSKQKNNALTQTQAANLECNPYSDKVIFSNIPFAARQLGVASE